MNIDRIVKLLPLGATVLIGLGVLKASVYYNYFGIDIMSYLSTSEAIALFLTDYQSIITLFLIGYFHFNVSERAFEFIEKEVIHYDLEVMLRKRKWIYFWVSISVVVLLTTLMMKQIIILNDVWIYFSAYSLSNAFAFYFVNQESDKPFYSNNKLVDFLQIISFVTVVPMLALKDITRVELNKSKRVIIELQDNTKLMTDYNYRFLGKAGENYFLFDIKNKSTMIIGKDQVDRVIMNQ